MTSPARVPRRPDASGLLAAVLVLSLSACGGGSAVPPAACTPTIACASAACGTPDGCGGTCGLGGLPCQAVAAPVRVEGGLTSGAARLTGPAHQLQGGVVPGAPAAELRGPAHLIQQGSLR